MTKTATRTLALGLGFLFFALGALVVVPRAEAASAHGFPRIGHAGISYSNATGVAETTGASGAAVTIADAAFSAGDVDSESMYTVSATNGTITANFAGTSLVAVSVTAIAGAAAHPGLVAAYVGSSISGCVSRALAPATPIDQTYACVFPVAHAKGDILTAKISSDTSSDAFTVKAFSFSATELERR